MRQYTTSPRAHLYMVLYGEPELEGRCAITAVQIQLCSAKNDNEKRRAVICHT